MSESTTAGDAPFDPDALPDPEELARLIEEAANSQNAGRSAPAPAVALPEHLSDDQVRQWIEDGYFVVRGLVSTDECAEIDRQAVERTRDILTTGDRFGNNAMKDGQFVVGENNFSDRAQPEAPEDHASKLYNLHRHPVFNEVARHPGINRCISGILGPDVDCFNSQFIFKNPGAWGQPWHQDSLYFTFDREPQVGMWLATSEATEENGCLWVAPGSHTEPLHPHITDRRPDANLGYLEIVDHDFSGAVPVCMSPGDVLVFHSFLMHKSSDNDSTDRRTALVYHYGQPGTRQVANESSTIDWMPTSRDAVAV